jgi:hypothetical protein
MILSSRREEITSEKNLRMQTVNPSDFPASYTSNSPEELLVLEYVENFRRQFVQLYVLCIHYFVIIRRKTRHLSINTSNPVTSSYIRYPLRKELLLCPRNEFGVQKFICTTIRPTQLEFIELYDIATCACT